jgi:hypothetical protein
MKMTKTEKRHAGRARAALFRERHKPIAIPNETVERVAAILATLASETGKKSISLNSGANMLIQAALRIRTEADVVINNTKKPPATTTQEAEKVVTGNGPKPNETAPVAAEQLHGPTPQKPPLVTEALLAWTNEQGTASQVVSSNTRKSPTPTTDEANNVETGAVSKLSGTAQIAANQSTRPTFQKPLKLSEAHLWLENETTIIVRFDKPDIRRYELKKMGYAIDHHAIVWYLECSSHEEISVSLDWVVRFLTDDKQPVKNAEGIRTY